jgi:hypothetical protein
MADIRHRGWPTLRLQGLFFCVAIMKAARRVFSVFTFRNVNTMTNNKLELKSTQQAFIIVLSQLVKTDCHTLLFICFCHSNFTDFTLNNTFFTLDIQYLTMRFKSGSNCSINNLGFSEAADAVFATLLRITGKLFPIIKVADIRYTAEIRTLYPTSSNLILQLYEDRSLNKAETELDGIIPCVGTIYARNWFLCLTRPFHRISRTSNMIFILIIIIIIIMLIIGSFFCDTSVTSPTGRFS